MHRAFRLALAALLAAAPAAAQERSLAIRSWDSDIVVNRDGTTDITETLRFAFTGSWNGVLRDLSLQHFTGQGRRERLRVRFGTITNENGEPYRHEVESVEDRSDVRRLRIWVPGAQDTERTVVIRYRLENAVRFFYADDEPGELDELYWNVTGNDWEIPIEQVRARVALPPGVTAKQTAGYTGVAGSTATDVDISSENGVYTFTSQRPLGQSEGMTIGVGWAPGAILSRPSAAAHQRAETIRWWPLAVPFVVLFMSLRAWLRRGRDPKEQSIAVAYEPPAELSPAEVGTLVDHQAQMRDITSTLVDLAVRGYLLIEERKEKKLFGLLSDTDYVFHLLPKAMSGEGLRAHERLYISALSSRGEPAEAMLEQLFATAQGSGGTATLVAEDMPQPVQSVRLSSLRNRFYKSLPSIKDAIYDALKERGYYQQRPDRVKAMWLGGAFALGFLAFFAGGFAAGMAVGWVHPGALVGALLVSALVLFVVGLVMPARTEQGARVRESALGFREFLDKVETDRYKRMITSPEMFERFLPYAMAFGCEKHWAQAFDDIYREPPRWYVGSYDGFRASTFSSRMSAMSTAAGSTMSSSPSSSGSGGGGSSGGGSGGGGGGGF